MSHSSLPFLRKLVGPATPELIPLSGRARGAAVGFRPMAVLHDQEQAFKSEPATASQPSAAAAPAKAASVLAPAACVHPNSGTARKARFFRSIAKSGVTRSAPTALSAGRRPSGPAPRLVLAGSFSEVCAELERLVAQEEHYLRAS